MNTTVKRSSMRGALNVSEYCCPCNEPRKRNKEELGEHTPGLICVR